jgi:hypothetical protein
MRDDEQLGRRLRWHWILLSAGVAALLAALLGAGYLYSATQTRLEEYRSRAEILAWAFADRVAFDLAQGKEQDLEFLAGTLVLGNVLYAQIVVGGEVLAEMNRLREPLKPAPPPEDVWTLERQRSDAQEYWDIRRALPDGQGYVRIGLSLEPLERELRALRLWTSGLGAAFVALVALIVFAVALIRPQDQAQLQAQMQVPASAPSLSSAPQTVKQVGDLVIDEAGKRVALKGQPVELSPKEFQVLCVLASEPGRVFSSQEILERAWPDNSLASDQDVKQYIYFLRQKLEDDPKHPKRIVTVRGFGYKLEA